MLKKQIKKILVFRIGQLGDTIVALPAMHAVRKHFPEAWIVLLSDRHTGKGYVLAEDLLFKMGLFDDFISYEANLDGSNPRKLLELLPGLRQRRFDLLVYLAPRTRTRLQVWRDLFFFKAAGIRKFIGHRGLESLPQKQNDVPLSFVEHEADHLLNRLGKSGLPVPNSGAGCTDLKLTIEEKREAKHFISAQLEHENFASLVGFGPGSKWPSKIWPKERYAEVGRQLISRFGIMPVILGGKEDRIAGDWLLTKWRKGVSAAGKLTVRESAAVLQLCHLYVGNDTGAMHLAAAVGTPCVAIFSAQDWPGRWYPYGNKNCVLRKPIPCEGCMMRICPKKSNQCLLEISVFEVQEACNSMLYGDESAVSWMAAARPSEMANWAFW